MKAGLQAIKDAWEASSRLKDEAVDRRQVVRCALWALENTPNEGQARDIAAAGLAGKNRKALEDEMAACEAQIAQARSGDDAVRGLADEYVTANPGEFGDFEAMDIEACVAAVGVFRAAGMEESQWRVETWLLHKFEPQDIGGTARAIVRFPGGRK